MLHSGVSGEDADDCREGVHFRVEGVQWFGGGGVVVRSSCRVGSLYIGGSPLLCSA